MTHLGFNVIHLPEYVFKTPTTITISGSTGSGKTTLVKRILQTPSLFSKPPDRIIYNYGVWQEAFNNMTNIDFRKGVDIPEVDISQHTLILFDDLMHEITSSKEAQDLFCLGSHHKNITIIFIVQNLYVQGRFAKTIMMNVHYMIVMNNARDVHQIKNLGRQLGLGTTVEEAYNDCMKQPYGYLLITLSPHHITNDSTVSLRLRSGIFPGDVQFVYI